MGTAQVPAAEGGGVADGGGVGDELFPPHAAAIARQNARAMPRADRWRMARIIRGGSQADKKGAMRGFRPRSSLTAPIAVSLTFSSIFIARTAFAAAGRVWFTLFDDAMISMRYARNLAQGHGLLWNAGQAPVEGYTNFLWTLAMALVHLAAGA